MSLRDLNLKSTFSSSHDNLIQDFYNPALKVARRYDRTTGYFSPRVFALASVGFANFFHNKGKIRLLTSVQVDKQTFESLSRYKDHLNSTPEGLLPSLNLDELQSQLERDQYDVFVHLLHIGIIDLRIVATADENGILHQKDGVIEDASGEAIAFSGSNNETVYGWSKNIDKFMVFPSWEPTTRQYFQSIVDDFETLWDGDSDAIQVMTIDEAMKKSAFKFCQPDIPIDQKIARISDSIDPASPPTVKDEYLDAEQDTVTIRPYQEAAIQSWINNNYMGIFEMATGTGKTITGLAAIKMLSEVNGRLFCVITVPLRHLVPQWLEDIKKILPQARLVKVGGDYPSWRDELPRQVRQYSKGRADQVIVITTYASMATDDFANIMKSYKNTYCLLADEAHNAGTQRTLAALDLFTYKLGLSATPRNKWTDIDEDSLVKSFGGIIYSYPLSKAIKNGVLVPYDYFPVPVHLTDEEATSYTELSKKISVAISRDEDNLNDSILTALLNRRSAIIKNADEKADTLRTLIAQLYEEGLYQKMLVYCDNQSQIAEAQKILNELNINSSKITFQESLSERWQLLRDFSTGFIDTLVARKCLDEGVNIPSTKTAILLASNTDSREYIQRLGRVLRTYPGKDKSTIYDLVVLPPNNKDPDKYKYLLRNELARISFFEENAVNTELVTYFRNDVELRYNFQEETE